jgi:hypothetical protein
MATEEHSIRVSVDSTDVTRAERSLHGLTNATISTERNLSSLSSTARASSAALSGLSGVLGGLSVAQFSKSVFEVNKEMQTLRVSLETVTGSAKNAEIAFQSIQKFASTTPYSVKEITEAFIKMKALGLAPTEAALTSFGNTASAMGKPLKQMIDAVAGATTGEMDRLKEFGIKASKQGDDIKFTFKGVTTTVKDNSADIVKYLEKIGNTDFAGGMERQGKTMQGTISSLADSWDAFQDHILNGAAENSIAQWVGNATNLLSRFDAWINGAFTKQGKLIELRTAQASALEKITASEKNGFGGRVADAVGEAVWGYSIENEKKKLAEIGKQMENIKKEIAADAITATKITAAAPIDKKTEETTKAKKGLSDAQKELNRQQDEYQRLIESTPYGEYNATIDKLTEGLKRGGEAFRATYSTGIDEANKKLLDSTQYVKDHTTALKEQQQALEGTARGKFEKGYSELMTQKPYMSDTEYSAGQDKLNADYLTQQQGVDFKTPAEQGKEALKAFNDEMDNTSKAFDKLGNSGSIAFDGILGGISAVAGAASSFATEIIKISDKQQASQEKYDAVIKSVGVTESEKADATKKFAADKIKLDAQAFSAEISGARQIAGATAKLFGEKSAARKAFHAIEMGMSVIEMAMAAKKMIVDVAAGAARMFAQGGFAGFAGVAAMAAIMGGLGFAMAGGGDKVTDLTTPETSTTGSVLGSDGASASIKNIVDTLNSIHASEYVELQGINSSFQNLTKLTTTSLALALRDKGAFSYNTNGFKNTGASVLSAANTASTALTLGVGGLLGFGLSMLLGIGKVKFEAVGGGIVSKAQKLMLDGMEKQIEVMDYTKIKKTVTGWFSNDVTYFDVITGANSQLTKLFQQVFSNVGTTLLQAATDSFKDTSLLNTDLTLPRIKLSLKSGEKNNAENQKKIEDAINKASDNIASQALGRYLSAFQQMGEGLYETTIRLSAQAAVASGGMEKLGIKTNLTGLGLITFSDSLTQAFGGLKEFKAGIDSLYEAFTSDPQKLIDSKKQVADFLTTLKAPAGAIPDEITSQADAAKVTDYLLKTKTGIAGVAGQVLSASNVKPDLTGMAALWKRVSNFENLPAANKKDVKRIAVEDLTTEILTKALEGSKYTLDSLKVTKPLIEYAKQNANFLASNQNLKTIRANKELEQSLNELGFTMPKTTEDAAKLSEKLTALSDKAAIQVKTFTDLTSATLKVISSQEKLAEAGKYVTDFSKSISVWIKNVRATTGSPVNQLGMAKANFEEQLKLAKFGATAEEKRSALSGITGYADTYMNAIKSYYATSEEGQKAIEDIMSQVSGLGQSVDVQELQLGALQDIKDKIDFSTIEIPKGISEANKELWQNLIDSTKAAGATALKDPTTDNLLNYNALAKIVLLIDKSAQQNADAAFLDALISSVAGESGLQAGIELIINNVDFEAAKKEQIIANLLSSFNEHRLTLTNFEFDVQAAIDAAKENVLASWGEPKLNVTTYDAVNKIAELDQLTSKLAENVKTEKALNVSTDTAVDNVLETRLAASFVEDYLKQQKDLNVSTDTANQKLTDSILLSGEFTAAAEFVPTMDVDTTTVIAKIADVINSATTATAALSALNGAKAAEADKSKTDAELLGTKWTSADIDSGEITFDELTRLRELNSATSKTNGTKSLTSFDEFQLNEYSGQSSLWMNGYAKGGIANTPSIFGEAGAEAAVPLPDGRSIPVTLYNSANDSSVSSEETIAELKAQNNKLEVLVNTLMATSKAEREKTQELIDAMNGLRSDTRLAARG